MVRPLVVASVAVPLGTVIVKEFVEIVAMSYSTPSKAATVLPSIRTRAPAGNPWPVRLTVAVVDATVMPPVVTFLMTQPGREASASRKR